MTATFMPRGAASRKIRQESRISRQPNLIINPATMRAATASAWAQPATNTTRPATAVAMKAKIGEDVLKRALDIERCPVGSRNQPRRCNVNHDAGEGCPED